MKGTDMENVEIELDGQRSPEAQKIIDAELGENNNVDMIEEDEDDLGLPSDKGNDEEPELFAGKYNSVDELKKGIVNIGSNLPQYVIDGMSAEALEKHYEELSKTTKTEERKPRKHTDKQDKTVDDIAEKDADKDGKPIKVDPDLWQELDSTFTTTGSISDEQYDKLNAAGIPDTMIDRYLDGIKSEQNAFTDKVYTLAGGQEEFMSIKSWAEDNQPDVVRTLNGMTDYNQILLVMKGVKADYDASNVGSKPNTVRGKPSAKSGGGYTSETDYLSDVNDTRYRTDQRFRDKVKAKLAKSSLTAS